MAGASDPRHFAYAARQNYVLVTKNHKDFAELHDLVIATGGRHPGVFVVRADNDPSRDMKDGEILRAIDNLEKPGVTIASEFHVLNPMALSAERRRTPLVAPGMPFLPSLPPRREFGVLLDMRELDIYKTATED